MDLSAPFAQPPLPERLRRLAASAEEAGDVAPDVYGAAPGLQRFEAEVAELLGKQAAAFFPTGTLAQRAALHVHRRHLGAAAGRVILHPTSHLAHHDCLRDGAAQAKRAKTEAATRLPSFPVEFVGELQHALALRDFTADGAGVRQNDVVVVELPQRMNGGRTMSWEDLEGLAKLAEAAGAVLHMDGARLWEVQPFYGRPLPEICRLFRSVYVSFYKGLGAMSGAVLCGDADFVAASREFRELLGGSVHAFAPAWIDARVQLRQCVLEEGFRLRFEKLREVVRALSEDSAVGRVVRFEPPVPQACMVHGYVRGTEESLEAAHTRVREATGARLWNRLRGRGYARAADGAAAGATAAPEDEMYFEWNMGPANAAVPTAAYLKAWGAFAQEMTPAG